MLIENIQFQNTTLITGWIIILIQIMILNYNITYN